MSKSQDFHSTDWVAISVGEPAGIGPDITLAALADKTNRQCVLVADLNMLESRRQDLSIELEFQEISSGDSLASWSSKERIPVLHHPLSEHTVAGELNKANSRYVLDCIDQCTDLCLNGLTSAMVTAPVHKGIINDAGIAFSGHTEWIAERCNAKLPVMMLASEQLRVCLATTHLPLHRVAEAITTSGLRQVIEIVHHDMQRLYGIDQPAIGVCGLNPHAGEDGHLGTEEKELIIPLLEIMRNEGMNLIGPLPADTAFTPHQLEKLDVVLAMYHDQGLPVIKHSSFGSIVNITLGLPIIRTSVDHGTALDLAGSGKAEYQSLLAAIDRAVAFSHH